MNKTISIALAGFSFTIEELAYVKLSDYLQALRKSLEPEEANEVMNDIEIRIVEILKARMEQREVVNNDDIEAVIAQIGTPEQIDEQGEEYSSTKKDTADTESGPKQLFRDPTDKKIGGVASGLAAYFGISVIWIRLLFIALIFIRGFGILLYIILWIVLPIAKTASDFLKMKGKPLNFDNLKEQSGKVVQFTTDSADKVSQYLNNNKQKINNSGDAILRVIAIIIGCFTSLFAVSFFLAALAIVFGGFSFGPGAVDVPHVISFYLGEGLISGTVIALGFLSFLIPAVILTMISIKLFSPAVKLRYMGWLVGLLVLVWVVTVGFVGYTVSKTQLMYGGTNQGQEQISINAPSDTLVLKENKIAITPNFKYYLYGIYSDRKTVYEYDHPDVTIRREDSTKIPYLVIKKRASGYNIPLRIKVPVQVQGNQISFPNYITYPYSDRLRDTDVRYELHVPRRFAVVKQGDVDIDQDDDHDDDDSAQNQVSINDSIIINNKKVAVRDLQDSLHMHGSKIFVKDGIINIKKGRKQIKIDDNGIQVKDGDREVNIGDN